MRMVVQHKTTERNNNLREVLGNAGIKATSELKGAIRSALLMQGCGKYCGIDKTGVIGLFVEHSQDEEYRENTDKSDSEDEEMVKVDSPSSSAPTWESSMNISSGERKMYKKYKSDDSKDESYVPPKGKVVAMDLGDGKTSEKTGLGDSKHANEKVSNTMERKDKGKVAIRDVGFRFGKGEKKETIEDSKEEELPETVSYGSMGKSTNEELMDCLYEIENNKGVPVVVEKVENEKDERKNEDILLGMIVNLNNRVAELEEWKTKVDKQGCTKCIQKPQTGKERRIPVVPALPIIQKRVEKGESSKMGAARKVCQEPTYKKKDEQRATEKISFAQVVKKEIKKDDGFQKMERRRTPKTKTPVIETRERHLTLRFSRDQGSKVYYTKGVNGEIIRCELNRTLEVLGSDSYFSVVKYNEWGDILLRLTDTKVEDIIVYYDKMRETIRNMDCGHFEFARDVKKVKMVVLGVPLARYGGEWNPEDWTDEAYEEIARDIERANKGITITAKPQWVGKLWKLKERRVRTSAITLVVEETEEVKTLLKREGNKRLSVRGLTRECRLFEERERTDVCYRCLGTGHRAV
ncbi:hypothetical protein HOY82DRAFT_542948 [Tuber indicum]|nr:hypothetical protein HOY82DRAFT_542948 [Tuber indicum]